MRFVIWLVVLLCLWAVGGFIWWTQYHEPAVEASAAVNRTPSLAAPPPRPAVGVDTWKFHTEEQWLADEVGRDIAEMVLYAKAPATPVAGAFTLETTAPDQANKFHYTAQAAGEKVAEDITLARHFWAVENYAGWAKQLLAAWKPAAPGTPSPVNTGLVQTLLHPAQGLLIVESRRISQALSQHPLDAELHEEAALVNAALALRESAGQFYDTRHSLCRITAHLAMAHALAGRLSACGQLADLIQLCLVGRSAEALQKIAQAPAELSGWSTALKMRATADWRLLAKPQSATLLEQMEYGRALASCLLVSRLQEFLHRVSASAEPEWSRIVMQQNFSVEEGHLFAKPSLVMELKDLSEDWKSWSGKDLKNDGLVLVVNDTPARCVVNSGEGKQVMEVLGWGDFAAFHQRHLCHSIQRTVDFLRNKWGVPQEDAAFEKAVGDLLKGMRLMPIVLKRCAQNTPSYATAMSGAQELCTQHPEFITGSNWGCLLQREKFGQQSSSIPNALAWFAPDLPFGTAYDFAGRYYELHNLWKAGADYWDELLAQSPYDYDVIRAQRHKKLGESISSQKVQESFAKTYDYDVKAMTEVARFSYNEKNVEKHIEVLNKLTQFAPDYFLDLGNYLQEHQRDADAAAAYQKAFEKAHDRVRMANMARWVVNYYFDHGRRDDALKIAKDAAEVYSYIGLETMALLMERMGNLEEAEKNFANIASRYNDAGPLSGFYLRHDQDPSYAFTLKKMTGEIFPDGIQKATLADFKDAPSDGSQILSANANTSRARLRRGDVIVALDGYRVHNLEQYMWVRGLTSDPHMTLIAWVGGKYVELKTSLPNRRFGCDMDTYRGK